AVRRRVDLEVVGEPGDVGRPGRSMRAAVGGDDAEKIAIQVIVENRHIARRLKDALRRTKPRYSGGPADVGLILMDLVLLEFLHPGDEFRLVLRRAGIDFPEGGKR